MRTCDSNLESFELDETLAPAGDCDAVGALRPGDRVGRYALIERVGAGGMGEVYAARDPELDRTIALKLLHHLRGNAGEERLIREAKAMAQLSNPHVIAVHDVGVHAGRVFVSMEFVDGPTLDAWCDEHRADVEAVLEMFIAAGRGLEAAHRAGIVHRDFKPSNVMVGSDGRPRVLDFGLAQASELAHGGRTDEGVPAVSLGERMTLTGAVVGTPRYMSPEQWGGVEVDARSDQFSFCVALYEGLYGQRPFPASSVPEIVHRVSAGRVACEPAGTCVPRRVRRVVRRGLSPDPADRFPDMTALLAALDPRAASRRRTRVYAALGGVAAVGAAYVFGVQHEPRSKCPTADTLWHELWDDARRGRVAAALDADPRPHVAALSPAVVGELDAWAETWASERADACRATHDRIEQSDALLDLRVACYDRAAARLGALVDVVVDSPGGRESAPAVARSLPGLAPCADEAWLRSRRPLPRGEGAAQRIEAGLEALGRARALQEAGHIDDADPILVRVSTEARDLAYEPLQAEASLLRADVLLDRGEVDAAETALVEALTQALAGGDEWLAAQASLELLDRVSTAGKRPEERKRWGTVATGILAKLGSPPELEGRLAYVRSWALRTEGDLPAAVESARDAVRFFELAHGDDHPATAAAYERVGIMLQQQGGPTRACGTSSAGSRSSAGCGATVIRGSRPRCATSRSRRAHWATRTERGSCSSRASRSTRPFTVAIRSTSRSR